MQNEIKTKQQLLNASGNIANPGFAKKLLWTYSRADIKAPKMRIKEWDYYYIGNQDYGLALTISDSGYVSCLSASILEFGKSPLQMNDSELGMLPLGKMNLPATSEAGNIHAKVGTANMSFDNDGEVRHLYGVYNNYCNTGKSLKFDVALSDFPEESMVIATPFDKDKHFYYNQKLIVCVQTDFLNLTASVMNSAIKTAQWARLIGAEACGHTTIRGIGALARCI